MTVTENALTNPSADVQLLYDELDSCRDAIRELREENAALREQALPPESAAGEGARLVHGARQNAYGHPADDFDKTGRMWGAVLEEWRRSSARDVPPELVGLMLVCVKISREVNAPKRDNRVDGAGYFETVELIHQRRGPNGHNLT